ncbi:hypothetical protein [Vibrio phage vB_VmeM-Yong XC32]|nr:hypothetical protein [Vibrio phage vB_VmeM-Yong XC31]QAX96320.1 hypothetical protein [Vibrio phage vB_VmeM-Yong XC32]QAX96638.1 hypothetical protein [Vibrio phage vB_VmeM-Yong MS31]QAX96956.1 hypothetical protein [Vibrio phage vB_VmeM-Yong MS32]
MINESPNLVLVKAIVGEFINRTLPQPNGKLETVTDKALALVKMPADTMGDGSEGEIAHALRTTLDWLRTLPEETTVNPVDLVERVRMNCAFGSDYIDSLERQIILEDDAFKNGERVKTIISELQFALRNQEFSQLFKDANKQVNFNRDGINIREFAKQFTENLREFENDDQSAEKAGFGGGLSTEDLDSVVEALRKSQEYVSSEGALKTGLKGLNKLLGGNGYRRGEQFNYGALTHNYKSGILLDHCRWFCRHNTPHLLDKNMKPMILRISFENKPEQDIPLMYRSLWEQENQKKVDFAKVDPQKAAKYIIDRMSATGFAFDMKCYDPNQFDVWDLIDVLAQYEAKGYEIAAVIIDYPELITKKYTGKSAKRTDEIITYTFEVLRNHCFPRGITQITAHQLSTEAQKLAREGTSNFAKKVATGSYYMGCQSLATKLDGECILHIHKIGEESFLTFARGKHRGGDQTPIKHRSMAYKFEEFGGICDDLDDESADGKALYSFAGIDGGHTEDGSGDTGGMVIDSSDW